MRSAVGDVNNKGVGAMSKGGWVGQRFREVHLEDVCWRFALFDRSWDKHYCQATALPQFISLGIFQKYMLFFSKTFGWLVEMTRTCWDGLKTTNQSSISGSQIFPWSGPHISRHKHHTPGRRATSNDADLGLGIQYTRRHPTEFPGSWKAVEMGKVREHMGFINTWDVIPPQSIKT